MVKLYDIYLLTALPNPVYGGALIDWSCLWKEMTCGFEGSCRVYNLDRFRYIMKLPAATGTLIAAALYLASSLRTKKQNQYVKKEEDIEKVKQDTDVKKDEDTERVKQDSDVRF